MSAVRRLQRASGRLVPPASAALVFSSRGDALEVRMVLPRGPAPKRGAPLPEHVELAAACGEYARGLLSENNNGRGEEEAASAASGGDNGEE